jgi:hypothetical protein
MIENRKWLSSLTTLSHKEYVTFGDDKKGKVLGTGIIKVNVHFTLNDVALVDNLKYNLLSVSHLLMIIWMCFFANMILMFLIPLAILYVTFLALGRFFRLISHLLNLL